MQCVNCGKDIIWDGCYNGWRHRLDPEWMCDWGFSETHAESDIMKVWDTQEQK
jgi:hypothetical protein